MKKTLFLSAFLVVASFANGQILKKVTDKVKNKVESKSDNKVDGTTNKNPGDATNGNSDAKKEEATNSVSNQQSSASIKSYSKYDFVPGEKIIVFEDFMQDAIGDLPSKWNTNASGETVTIEGKPGHWFKMTNKGVFMPDFIDTLPDDFTLELDLLADAPVHSWGFNIVLAQLNKRDDPADWPQSDNYFNLNLLPGTDGQGSTNYEQKKSGNYIAAPTAQIRSFADITRPVHISMWRQKERIRIYLNEDKTWDVPKAISQQAKLNSFILFIQLTDNWNFYISNLRLAVGAPDTLKKILEQNKWVTHGILFDVNSATIKPESYGTLKEMANVMKDYSDLKVKIVGHTDADGSDAANLDLSKRRAASVRAMLAKEFGIDESRMETDGKGESEPIDKNDNPAGKANNRRVEFIKI